MSHLDLAQFRFLNADDALIVAMIEPLSYLTDMERLSRCEGDAPLADAAFKAQEALLAAITALDRFYAEDARAADASGAYTLIAQ
ncbi:hypothetical protein [Methylobacterium nonmethylotrophicum]|uniref:hypothetical protein n=1 Tax=Methylobacterium nonmethylotrophicum TaxID=1141884 RepID=UPI001436A692|nr:hypothetical protein [Methylobacterium nonmethylotrophicum]